MAQKRKTSTKRKAPARKSSKLSFSRFSTRNLLIFALLFAAVMGYVIWKSFAANNQVYDSTTVDRTESHGENPVSDSSKSVGVYSIEPYTLTTGGQQDGILVMSKTVPQAVYNACVYGKVTDNTPSNPTGVFAAKHGLTGSNIASKTFAYANTSGYNKIACLAVTHNTNDPLVFTTSDKTLGTRMNISIVVLEKVGSVTTPPPPPPSDQPYGAAANIKNWTLKFSDEFSGTSLDRDKWANCWWSSANCSGNMNNVHPIPANVSVSGGNLVLTLSDSSTGALVATSPVVGAHVGYTFQYGYAEARVYFPGNGSKCYNWPAWWLDSYPHPAGGENDIAEVLSGGDMTVNYHSPSGSHNQGSVSGYWCGGFHVYGAYRQPGKVDVYYDGNKVKSYSTDDNGANEYLLFNVGKTSGSYSAYGTASQVKVDYARVWQ